MKLTINFDSRDRKQEDVETINSALAPLKIADFSLENYSFYLAKTTSCSSGASDVSFRLGLDRGTMMIETDKYGRQYQIEMFTCEHIESADTKKIHDKWELSNPGRRITAMVTVRFKEDDAYGILVVHCSKDLLGGIRT